MKIFLDTADYDAISMRYDTGLIDGVTTNPSLIKKSGDDPFEQSKQSPNHSLISNQSLQRLLQIWRVTWLNSKPFMELDNVTIKVPCTVEGLRFLSSTTRPRCNSQCYPYFLCCSVRACCWAGATYVSPFVGRLTDNGFDGLELIKTIYDIYARQLSVLRSLLHLFVALRLSHFVIVKVLIS